ncbi:uncharacterized protein HD556DRAFT_1495891 [Suillus plorans]|uniref:Ferric oxidoreductase domain-containing protein n=1 Tax=Suillus plorans TaxID=116603 RepID=A0A9P7DCW1_9AGAM|nr:uncharacterized protein HD556DRAFT_1495891 [Suillus plorans]KAG1788976.1 hypothetical protein HD556DRAFT_1495891 [Suillus plorans]
MSFRTFPRFGRPSDIILKLRAHTREPPPIRRRHHKLVGAWNALISPMCWSPPKLGLNLGQIIVLLAHLAAVLVCIIKDAPLISNPNRATRISRSFWSSFCSQQKTQDGRKNHVSRWMHPWKGTSGVALFALLSIIVLTSLRPVRRLFYESFFVVHILTYVAFFVTICYHTLYASPWIFPPLAFYGADILLRLFRYRIKDATLTAQDVHMSLIRVHNCDDGWLAGQHIRLRVFFSDRVFESHPFTILSAPPSHSCLSSPRFLLTARSDGDWTRALSDYT